MKTHWHSLRLLCGRFGVALLWVGLMVGVAIVINFVGIAVVGDIEGWTRWLRDHSGYFLIWRLCLYGFTAYAWYRMRQRLQQRAGATEPSVRLRLCEVMTVMAVLLFEINRL